MTPFGPANQERLIQVLAYGAGNISSSAFNIVLVADAYSSRRRALLSWPWEGVMVAHVTPHRSACCRRYEDCMCTCMRPCGLWLAVTHSVLDET